jgi:N-acetyl-anhydromuramyl-L-alanine amidase AmpD
VAVAKPELTVIGTAGQNIFQGIHNAKQAIVCHIMEGTLAGCDGWFSNPGAQASANYGVGKDGSIHQYVDPQGTDAPFANGLLANQDAAVQALMAANPAGTNPNWITVSIEHEGHSGDALTPAQLAASAQLSAWLCETFAITADEDHLLGHYEFDAVTRARCPGWDRAAWLRYEGAVTALLARPVPTNNDLEEMHRIVDAQPFVAADLITYASRFS